MNLAQRVHARYIMMLLIRSGKLQIKPLTRRQKIKRYFSNKIIEWRGKLHYQKKGSKV